jgi:hypothetical protein
MANEQVVDYRPIYTPFGSFTVTPSNTTVFNPPCRKLYIGGPTVATLNLVVVRMLDGSEPTFSCIPGTTLDIQFDQVRTTDANIGGSNTTSATLMVATY